MAPLLFLRRQNYRYLHHAFFSTSSSSISLASPTFTIWGANTGVGKTLVSAGLSISVLCSAPPRSSLLYLKPLQTGYPLDSDSRYVFRRVCNHCLNNHVGSGLSLTASNEILCASDSAKSSVDLMYEEKEVGENGEGEKRVSLECKTLYAWREAVGPHLAAEREGLMVKDEKLREVLGRFLGMKSRDEENKWRIIETAGGVASPGPTGTLQCDLYRPFRLPGVLVGDGRLGGISSTISAYETLILRGYDVPAVILEDNGLSNELPLLSYLKNKVPVLVLPPIPKEDPSDDLTEWFEHSRTVFDALSEKLSTFHEKRLERLNSMPKKAKDLFWWPFTQHDLIPESSITVIDSRCAENFSVYKVKEGKEAIIPQFDACASWWTQGPDLSLQTELAREVGYSSARFGHVMFPENVYEPALSCAELLLQGVGKGWASRVYYSDNGSTAIEIALKMAFRKFMHDHDIMQDLESGKLSSGKFQLKVLALNGSYHGDTLGAMEAQAPSSYTGFFQQPWYSGRGIFLDPPTIFINNKTWTLSLPDSLLCEQPNFKQNTSFELLSEVFSHSRDATGTADLYKSYISKQLSLYCGSDKETRIGALLIEPVIQGAGGMQMIDPLFQRILISQSRKLNIPVIFDEVFTGFWRLGRESATQLLGCVPDIGCYAKLMTGGVVPLAATLATEDVFEVFRSDSKLMALLHGHSYSAHAMGCSSATKAIQWFKDPCTNPNLDSDGSKLKELWDEKLVNEISCLPNVKRIVVIGTVCAIELIPDGSDTGYGSQYTTSLIRKLREDGVYMRPLGNVIYLMCGPCTPRDSCNQQLTKVYRRISALDSKREEENQLDGNNNSICERQSASVY